MQVAWGPRPARAQFNFAPLLRHLSNGPEIGGPESGVEKAGSERDSRQVEMLCPPERFARPNVLPVCKFALATALKISCFS